MSFTGDRNELLSTSTFLLSVHALLGDLSSSLSTGNTINKKDVQSLIRTLEKWKKQRNTALNTSGICNRHYAEGMIK